MPSPTIPATVLLTWSAPVHSLQKRGILWYITTIGIVVLLLFYSYFTRAWSFGIVVTLLTIAYTLLHQYAVGDKTLTITQQGVFFEKQFTTWNDLESFWMLQGKDHVELHIAKKAKLSTEIVIQTAEIDPYLIRSVLLNFITEQAGRHERILDAIARLCKL